MKKIVFTIIFVLANLQIKAQDYSKWNVSLNFSSDLNSSILIVPGVNYSLSNSVEVGFIPSYYVDKIDFGNGVTRKTTSWGANVIGKFYIFRGNIMDPYGSLMVGYGESTRTFNGYTRRQNSVNYSVLLGSELQIGKKGWNFDFNVGFLHKGHLKEGEFGPIYTIGVKKRFIIN